MKSKPQNPGPILVKVTVIASSSKETVKKDDSGRLHICVREPAAENRANARILEIVRSLYPHSRVKIIKGHHKDHKIIEIT